MMDENGRAGKMVELAERCEQATGADRDIDVAIVEAIGWRRRGGFWLGEYWERGTKRIWFNQIPPLTASVEMAFALKEDGQGYDLHSEYGDEKAPGSHTYALTGRHVARIYTPAHGSFESTAASPALAFTAASLRARASHILEESDNG